MSRTDLGWVSRKDQTIIDYVKFARAFNRRFPGFETDVHGLVEQEVDAEIGYFVDCVRPRTQ